MSDAIRPQPGILEIAPYQGGKAQVAGVAQAVKLSSNENPFGAPDRAKEAFLRAVHSLHRYPSGDHGRLRAAIGEVHDLDPARVICGAGSDEILQLIAQTYAGPRDEVLFTEHGFLLYRSLALAAGATPVEVAERERRVDVDAILRGVGPRTRIVFIANPNNPTGAMLAPDEVARLAAGLPRQVLLVLDGAYAEYIEGFDGGRALIDSTDNVMMTRTFSKIYGLGGLRVGWGYGPQAVIDTLNRVRLPFNLSTAQLDAAEAAVRDQDWVARSRAENARMRSWLAAALAEAGVPSDPSSANFILARLASADEAEACDAFLQSQGLIVRRVDAYNLPGCLRITVGDEASCRRVAHAVAQFRGMR